MQDPSLAEMQEYMIENMRQAALSIMSAQDLVNEGDYEGADNALKHIEEGVGHSRRAIQGMQILQQAQEI